MSCRKCGLWNRWLETQLTGSSTARDADGSIESRTLRRWARRHGRSFPWRSCSGYPIAVAEVLLQKTRGEAIEDVWRAVLKRYPAPETLARSRSGPLERIVAPLGLGEQRASRLRDMARTWQAMLSDKGRVRGLGPYGQALTRLSLGLASATTPVDGASARVISRYHGFLFPHGEPRKKPEVQMEVMALIGRSRPPTAIATILALVDLGTTICKPRNPACERCPLRSGCAWRAANR